MTDIHIDLDEYQAIMEGLPAPAKGERRQHSLTRDDILVIAKIVKATAHQTCALGFSSEEVKQVQTVIRTVNKGILVVGYAILAAVGAALVAATGWAVRMGIADLTKR